MTDARPLYVHHRQDRQPDRLADRRPDRLSDRLADRGMAREPLRPTGRATTLAEVAAEAGVSLATASKALNGQPRVSEETRRRVVDAARMLGYATAAEPSPVRKEERSHLIGMLLDATPERAHAAAMLGAEAELSAAGNLLIVRNARGDTQLERDALALFADRHVDGVLVVGGDGQTRRSLRREAGATPVVYAMSASRSAHDCSVVRDEAAIGEVAARHLISCGRRRIAIIGGDEASPVMRRRLDGTLAALGDAGLEPAGEIRRNVGSEAWGRAATRLLLDQGVDADAILCQDDRIARGCLSVLRQTGRSVPQSVAVIGLGDAPEPFARESTPPLTTVADPSERIGRLAARRLLDAIDGRPHAGVETVACRLAQRESTLPLD